MSAGAGPAAAVWVALAAALAGCGARSPAPAAAPGPALATLTTRLEPGTLERPVDGTVEAVNQATVSAQTSGRVAAILYDVNDYVPAGAVIMRLQSTLQRAGLRQAEAALGEAEARNAEAVSNDQRLTDLYARRLIAKAQLDQATANRAAAAARLASAAAALTAAREGVGYTEITAPYAGVVTRRLVEVGETVTPGKPLMTGLSLRDLRVSFAVPESIAPAVRRIRKAAVYVGAERIEATRITLFPEASAQSSTFRARLELPPASAELSPGMIVKVGLVIGASERLLVPASAVIERSEVTAVYVVDARNRAELRYIRPGHRVGERLEVLAGVSPGERVALDPLAAAAARAQPSR